MSVIALQRGNIIPVPNMRVPEQGPMALPFVLDFSATASINSDLRGAFDSGEFDFAQSVYIDNSLNASTLNLVMNGSGPKGQTITAQPFSQGYYPVSPSMGDGRFTATTAGGIQIPIMFYNVPMPYYTWGPVPGVLVVPTLTNASINIPALTVGDNVIVAGVANQTIKVYRMFYTLGAGAVLSLQDTAGTRWTGDMNTFVGGGAAFQPSGVPWFTTGVAAGLKIVSSTNAQLGGAIGYVQS